MCEIKLEVLSLRSWRYLAVTYYLWIIQSVLLRNKNKASVLSINTVFTTGLILKIKQRSVEILKMKHYTNNLFFNIYAYSTSGNVSLNWEQCKWNLSRFRKGGEGDSFFFSRLHLSWLLLVTVSLSCFCTEDLSISFSLASPYGTIFQLFFLRSWDDSKNGLSNWTIMTISSWEESPVGVWKLTVSYIWLIYASTDK